MEYGQLLLRNNKENEFLQDNGHMVLITIGFVELISIGLVIFTIAASVKNLNSDGKYLHKEIAYQTLMIGLGLVMFPIATFGYTITAYGKCLSKSVALLYTSKNDDLDHFFARSVSLSDRGICVPKVSTAHNDVR